MMTPATDEGRTSKLPALQFGRKSEAPPLKAPEKVSPESNVIRYRSAMHSGNEGKIERHRIQSESSKIGASTRMFAEPNHGGGKETTNKKEIDDGKR
jgi:hypothetical protein